MTTTVLLERTAPTGDLFDRPDPADDSTRREFIAGGIATALLVGACGGDDESDNGDGQAAGDTRIVEHALGESEVPVRAERIVTTDYDTTATLLALGTRPIGANNLDLDLAYLEGKTDGIAEVGGSDGLPNLESTARLEPDLIVGPPDTIEEAYTELQQIAPTVALTDNPWREDLRFLAAVTGRDEQAEEIIRAHDERVEGLRPRLEGTGTVSIMRSDEDGTFRIYGRSSDGAGTLLDELGLARPASEDGSEELIQGLSIELLEAFAAADVLFVIVRSVGETVTGRELDELAQNPLWQRLPAVQAGRAFVVDPQYWIEANPFAINGILDDIERHLINS